MQDYSISRCSRKCAVSGRSLEPGEKYVSVILPSGDGLRRIDIADSQWQGCPWQTPGAETIGWWRSRMPAAAARKLRPAPSGVLLDTLSELLERPGGGPLAYLLALLLVRRRVLTEEQSLHETDSEKPPMRWDLVCPADGRKWSVPVVDLAPGAVPALQSELTALLYTEE